MLLEGPDRARVYFWPENEYLYVFGYDDGVLTDSVISKSLVQVRCIEDACLT